MPSPPCPKCRQPLSADALKNAKCASCGKRFRVVRRKPTAAAAPVQTPPTVTVVSTVSLAVQWLAFGLLLLVVLAALLILYKGKDWHLGNVWYVFAFLGLGLLAFLYWAEFMVSISTTVEDDDKNAPPS